MRATMRGVCVAALLLGAGALCAQRGGGPPGGGGGMGGPPPMGGGGAVGGGGFGGPRGGMEARETFVPQRPAGPQLGLPGRWWDDKKAIKTLSLSSDQQHKMDGIFNASKGTLINLLTNLRREESRLESMSPQELSDEGKVFAQIDRVEAARADLEKENAHILMQIRQQLDTRQLSKLDEEIANLR